MLEINFEVNHEEASEGFGPLPDGEYELFITGAKVSEPSRNGNYGVQMVLVVRDDVPQQGQGRKIWHTVWFTDKTKGIVQAFFKALDFPSGTKFATLQEVVDAVRGLPVRAKVGLQRENKDFNEIKSFMVARKEGFYEAPEQTSEAYGDISDEDLPF